MREVNYYSMMKIELITGELNVPKSRWLRKLGLMETWFIIFHDLKCGFDDLVIVRSNPVELDKLS